jgi:hypothetical protein
VYFDFSLCLVEENYQRESKGRESKKRNALFLLFGTQEK